MHYGQKLWSLPIWRTANTCLRIVRVSTSVSVVESGLSHLFTNNFVFSGYCTRFFTTRVVVYTCMFSTYWLLSASLVISTLWKRQEPCQKFQTSSSGRPRAALTFFQLKVFIGAKVRHVAGLTTDTGTVFGDWYSGRQILHAIHRWEPRGAHRIPGT